MTRILAFAGSARRQSFNKQLVGLAAAQARALGADVTLVDLRELPMPLYDGDLEDEQGVPPNVVELGALMLSHDALLLACPEYNGSITPLLKNTIDWLSRPYGDLAPLAAFEGKLAALLSASPGGFGGMRGLVHVRAILSGIGVHVIPQDVSVPAAHKAFGDGGALVDGKLAGRLSAVVSALVETAGKLRG